MNYYLGIDIGTSSTKGVLFDAYGNKIISKSEEYDIISPYPLYKEQDPLCFKNATFNVIKEITKEYPYIKGISFTGQMHGLVLLDKFDKPLRNAIIWCDNRTTLEAKEMEDEISNERFKEITGSHIMPSFTLAKLLWVKNNEPSIYKKIDKIMLPKDYVRYTLLNVFATDYSDASGMQLLDIKNKCYSNEILKAFDIDTKILPPLHESMDVLGYLDDSIKDMLHIKGDCFIVTGGSDQAINALGNGIVKPSDLSISLGSSGVLFSPILKKDIQNQKLEVFMHAIPNLYHTMGVTNGCGLSYKWFKDNLCLDLKNESKPYELLNKECSKDPLSNGLIYLPYLNGERTPHLDPYAKGCFLGINNDTKRGDFIRAIFEGISYSMKDCLNLIGEDQNKILICGGLAKGEELREVLATILNKKLIRIENDESGCLGAAILAMVSNKEYNNVYEALDKIIKIKDETLPIKENVNQYETGYYLYQKLYRTLKDYFKEKYEKEGL